MWPVAKLKMKAKREAAATMTKTITRPDLVAALNEEVGLSHTDCADLLEGVLDEITDALASGEKVKIAGFATFKPHQKVQRTGRNPKTGEEVPIPSRRVVMFRPSIGMRAKINGAEG
jgi:integration host factor subunit alpha